MCAPRPDELAIIDLQHLKYPGMRWPPRIGEAATGRSFSRGARGKERTMAIRRCWRGEARVGPMMGQDREPSPRFTRRWRAPLGGAVQQRATTIGEPHLPSVSISDSQGRRGPPATTHSPVDPLELAPPGHGLEHPDEIFEFARFCLLNHYARNDRFVGELKGLACNHLQTLDAIAEQPLSQGISELADYRVAWGTLSFLARDPAPGKVAHLLKSPIDSYRAELSALARKWGLAADWCAPSLHVALLAPRAFPGNFDDPSQVQRLTSLFAWDLQRQGSPPHDTLLPLPRLLLQSDAPGRQVDIRLLSHAGDTVYYDPRMDRWNDSLARVRSLLGKKRLSSRFKQELLRRRRQIESAFSAEGYAARRKPRRLRGQHALARWTYWTYLAICPPRRTTRQILELIVRPEIDTQHVDRAIKCVLDLLGLPGRPVRPT